MNLSSLFQLVKTSRFKYHQGNVNELWITFDFSTGHNGRGEAFKVSIHDTGFINVEWFPQYGVPPKMEEKLNETEAFNFIHEIIDHT